MPEMTWSAKERQDSAARIGSPRRVDLLGRKGTTLPTISRILFSERFKLNQALVIIQD